MTRGTNAAWWWGALVVCLLASPTSADDSLTTIQQRGTLLWGGDAEGGGPFVFPRDDQPNHVQGFEVDLADLLASKLGVRAQFVQGPWDRLPELLKRSEIDVVLDGYEWKPAWQGEYGTTIPYYVYQLQWLTRRNDSRFGTLEDLRRASPELPRVGVLGASAAETYVREQFGDRAKIVVFEGTTDAMRAVELQADGLDATVQDLPIVSFYEPRFPALHRIGPPVATGYYVGLTRYEDTTLVKALNTAIVNSLQDGTLQAICEKYGMWNPIQAQRGLSTDVRGNFAPHGANPIATVGGEIGGGRTSRDQLWRRIPLLLQGALLTIGLSVTSMPLAIALGILIATGRVYGPRWMQRSLTLYVEIMRGTPLVLQLYVIFFLLPEFGISLPALLAAVLGLSLNYSAYEAEIYRAGFQAVPAGQMEAALSLGLTTRQAIFRIVLPQAFRIVIPPVLNDFIALFKDTAVCSVITVVELSKQYYIQAQSTGAVVELALVTALFYLAMSYPLAVLVGYWDKRLQTPAHT